MNNLKRKIKRVINLLWIRIFIKRKGWIQKNGYNIRGYKSYNQYVKHQQSKLESIDLKGYTDRFYYGLKNRLENSKDLFFGKRVLCLGARLGTEVKVFIDFNCLAIGIDLNAGRKNKYVVYGDFHHIQYPNESFDVVFTNSLDHAFDVDEVIGEIKRVLRKRGFLIMEIGNDQARHHESLSWKDNNDMVKLFTDKGFEILKRENFESPWLGESVIMKVGNFED